MDAESHKSLQKEESMLKEVTLTLRSTPYTYLHLSLTNITEPIARAPLDSITARTYLTSALSQFLGLTGTAIPIDIIKVTERHFWVRLPKEDARAVVAALGQWTNTMVGVSLRVEGRGEWLGGIVAGAELRRDQLFSLEK
jgi:ribonuclease P/MRP protein subunit POP8